MINQQKQKKHRHNSRGRRRPGIVVVGRRACVRVSSLAGEVRIVPGCAHHLPPVRVAAAAVGAVSIHGGVRPLPVVGVVGTAWVHRHVGVAAEARGWRPAGEEVRLVILVVRPTRSVGQTHGRDVNITSL